MRGWLVPLRQLQLPALLALLGVSLWAYASHYLLFHLLVELFSIIVGVTIGFIVWHTYPFSRNHYLMYLGCGYVWVAVLDLAHTLAYKGMNLYPVSGANVATQLWIASRYIEAFLLLSSPWFFRHRLHRGWAFAAFGLATIWVFAAIHFGLFPTAYIEGVGLTPFKIDSEYIIMAMLAAAGALLWRHRADLDAGTLHLVLGSILLTILSELMFTRYVSVYDYANFLGHIGKLLSFWLIFVAIVRTMLREPFLLMARGANTFDAVPDQVAVVDSQGIVRQVNRAAHIFAGQPESRLLGQHCHQLFHVPNVASEACPVCRQIATGRAGGPFVLQRGEAGPWLEIVLSPISAFGGLQGLVHVARDISQRQRREQELAELRRYLKNVIDSMPSVMVGVDIDGRVTHWNAEAERFTHLLQDTVLDRRLDEVLPTFARHMSEIRRAIELRQPVRHARQPYERDGESIVLDTMIYPLVANGVVGAVVWMNDVTDQVQLESTMIQAEKMMSVGGLAAGMAHEINNPLAGILQSLQNIRRRLSPDLAKNNEVAASLALDLAVVQQYMQKRGIDRFMDAVEIAGQQAADIVRHMLGFSRKSDMQKAAVDLGRLIANTLELAGVDYELKRRYDFRNIAIEQRIAPDLPEVPCIATEIQQVLLNLLRNAAQAMLSGPLPIEHPRIVIEAVREGDRVRIDVEDNGPGMDEEAQRRAFEPFFTTKEPGEGTGLGLSVSYFIVRDEHQGDFAVESEPGRTRFSFWLPMKEQVQ